MRAKLYLAWSVLKALFAVAVSPALAILFFLSKEWFVEVLADLWPHIDIFTPEGELYLRRWIFLPKTALGPRPRFLHLICLPDAGRDPHDHPGAFTTTPLWNGYDEEIFFPKGFNPNDKTHSYERISFGRPGKPWIRQVRAWETYVNPEGHTHRVQLTGPTLTWVVGWRKGKPWGFWIMHPTDPTQDRWVDSEAYGEKGAERKSWTIDGK